MYSPFLTRQLLSQKIMKTVAVKVIYQEKIGCKYVSDPKIWLFNWIILSYTNPQYKPTEWNSFPIGEYMWNNL